MRQGHLSQLDIQCLVLKHPPQKFETYEDELQYLITHSQRNNFIRNLTLDLKGNTLVLYSRVQTHGAVLYELINNGKKKIERYFSFTVELMPKKEKPFVKSLKEKLTQSL